MRKFTPAEERGICSAALRELLRIVKGVVVIVSNRESAIWRDESVKTVLRENQLKYVDVEGMRVVTDNSVQQNKSRMIKQRTS